MRRTLIGLAAVGTLVLGACGGDDDSASGDAATGASAEGSGSSGEFCSTIRDLMDASTGANADPQAARESVSNLEPPAAIADEWAQYMDLMEASQDLDADDPEAQAEYQQRVADANEASLAVNNYLTSECGISDGTSSNGSASGSSGASGASEPSGGSGAPASSVPGGQ
jgi:hypothetical protein